MKLELRDSEGGHDWFHVERVFRNSMLISKDEDVDQLIVSLAALLHDVADSKFHDGDETIGPKKARSFLEKIEVDEKSIDHVIKIIEHISYKNSLKGEGKKFSSKELDVVQDADRLDAIGAIGIARCFNFGGFKNRVLFDPDILPNQNMSKMDYKKSNGPTINHFYEKLLLLKDKMNTDSGRRIAIIRHNYMEDFLEQFYNEWDANTF